LIVDDDAQVCFVATRSLESIARTDAVHDVAEAAHALAHDTYDLVLLDVSLPDPRHDAARRTAPAVGRRPRRSCCRAERTWRWRGSTRGAARWDTSSSRFRVRDLRIQVTAALARRARSAGSALAATRGRIGAELARLIEEDPRRACFIVEIEHLRC